MPKKTAIRTKNLSVWYGNLQALNSVSVAIAQGKITALIGASGSGKSSFLRTLNRIIDLIPQSRVEGEVKVYRSAIYTPDTDVITLRRQVGMVFQNPTPFPLSVYDNIAYGLEIQGISKRPRRWWESLTRAKINPDQLEKSEHPIDQLVVSSLREAALWDEVKDRLHHSAYRLSGGQQQRLCIARAIALRPQILLLDEPCSALDPISTRKIEQLLLQLKKHYTIVIVTHNMHQAKRISDSVGFFHLGKLIEFGTSKKVFGNPTKKLTREYVRGEFG